MGLKLKRKQRIAIPPLEENSYLATCIGYAELGQQYNEQYKNYSDKLILIFEILGHTIEIDGEVKPRWFTKELTNSLADRANLNKYITALYGKLDDDVDEFEASLLLEKSVFLQLTVKESKKSPGVSYNDIASIVKVPNGMTVEKYKSDLIKLDFDEWSDEAFQLLPSWIQDKIRNSPTYQNMGKPPEKVEFTDEAEDETIPDKADF